MKVSYDESDNSIEINDNLKTQYWFLKALMILNLINAILRLGMIDVGNYSFFEYLWIPIGLISLVYIYVYFFKKSTVKKIPLSDIEYMQEKSLLGRKIIALKLTNGKTRDLGQFKNAFELVKTKEILSKKNILFMKK